MNLVVVIMKNDRPSQSTNLSFLCFFETTKNLSSAVTVFFFFFFFYMCDAYIWMNVMVDDPRIQQWKHGNEWQSILSIILIVQLYLDGIALTKKKHFFVCYFNSLKLLTIQDEIWNLNGFFLDDCQLFFVSSKDG